MRATCNSLEEVSLGATIAGGWQMKADQDLFPVEQYRPQLAVGRDVVPIYAASKPLTAQDFPGLVGAW